MAWRAGDRTGRLADLDPDHLLRLAGLVRGLVGHELLAGVHDVSAGGLALALAELAVRSGVGSSVDGVPSTAHLFAEAPGRVVAVVGEANLQAVVDAADAAGIDHGVIGSAGGDRVTIGGPAGALVDTALDALTRTWRDRLPDALGAGTTQA